MLPKPAAGEKMKEYLFAPLEGITLFRYRQLHHEMFDGVAEYYTPFIAPDSKGSFKPRFLRELTADCGGLRVIPQLLVNNADSFCLTAEKLCDLGFHEINLNTGCPSGTVFSKHKGAGMLTDLSALDSILGKIYEHAAKSGYTVSIKTRMGVHSTGEFPAILKIFEKVPVSKLIVHARCRDEYYTGLCDMDGFAESIRDCRIPVTYNGDLTSAADLERLHLAAPQIESVMIGRAAVANPALFRFLQGGAQLTRGELKEFHDRLLQASLDDGLAPAFAVERMKTIWSFMRDLFPDNRREIKTLMKARTMADYRSAAESLLLSGNLQLPSC